MAKQKTNTKKKPGRPPKPVVKRIEEKHFSLETIEKLAMYGLNDVELGDMLGVNECTINRWKKDPLFLQALKKGKLVADLEIEKSLYERAKGYEHEDTYFATFQGTVISETYTKHYPPDTAAAFIWLKNRRPALWRDRQEVVYPEGVKIIRDTIPKKLKEKTDAK